jgi:8-oxo-dGTP pyrophosphatase MutT (NUDIX family)
MPCIPPDNTLNTPYRGLVSVKGVIVHLDTVLLLRNERDEWELPGGKLERGESPESCVVREIDEELGLHVQAGPILDAWLYQDIIPGVDVFIVTYGCYPGQSTRFTVSEEHSAAAYVPIDELDRLPMPEGYKRSIRNWFHDVRRSCGSTDTVYDE